MKKQNILIQFIKEHPALTISEISKLTKFSPTLLYGILDGKKKLNTGKAFQIAKALSHYGLRLNGWIFEPYSWEEMPEHLQAYRFTDDEQEVIDIHVYNETGIETSCTIKYKITIQKDMMDMFDFAQLINL